ncbi:MAG: hypothetical protein JWN72_899 [Thermoleophilia bacterium]|nr:hypothetical protein [Thermoleophilia bacterium]
MARYERRRAERHNVLVRPVRIALGILLIVGGVLIGWLPGPGFIILALPGAFLLASEVRRAARILDRIENVTIPRLKRLHARLRGGPKPEWVEEDPQLWADWCTRTGATLHEDGEPPAPPSRSAVEVTTTHGGVAHADGEPAGDPAPR